MDHDGPDPEHGSEATHSGAALGRSPTGERLTGTENEIFRLEDGRVAESWGEGTLDQALASVGFSFSAKEGAASSGRRE